MRAFMGQRERQELVDGIGGFRAQARDQALARAAIAESARIEFEGRQP